MRVEISLDHLESMLGEKILGKKVKPKDLEIVVVELGKVYKYHTYVMGNVLELNQIKVMYVNEDDPTDVMEVVLELGELTDMQIADVVDISFGIF